jgi:endonuclease G
MAPAADFSRSADQMRDSFYLSNMVPQWGENNRGPWAQLEGHVRKVTVKVNDTYVHTGPGFPGPDFETTKRGRVGIPTQLYKVVFDAKHGRMSAWLLPNADVPKDRWNDYCTSVAKVEQATGWKFFPKLPAAQRDQLVQMSCAL